MPTPLHALVSVAVLALVAGGAAGAARSSPQLTIYAAASLTEAFQRFDPGERYSFGGSNQLALQIRNGAPADVFASASPRYTQSLFAAGLVDRPLTFASNRLVLIVPKSNPARIRSVYDLARVRAKVVLAAPAVPVGAYARAVLRKLGLAAAVLPKVVSNETDVKGVVGKIALGEGDAGLVYETDAKPVAGRVRVIAIPAWAQPRVRYEIAVVSSSKNVARARAWIARLRSAAGRKVLAGAGFGT